MSYEPIPLTEMDGSTLDHPSRRRRKTSPSSDSPTRFLLSVGLLLAFGLASFFLWTRGLPVYRKLLKGYNPHSDQKVSSLDSHLSETEVVRPLFGGKETGGVEKFDLVASILFIDHGWKRKPRWAGFNGTAANTSTESNSGGVTMIPTSDGGFERLVKEAEWERLFSEVVAQDLDVSTSSHAITARVTLPGRVVSTMREESWSADLQAIFHLQPSSPSPSVFVPLNTTHFLSSLNASLPRIFSYHQERMPLPYPALGTKLSKQRNETSPWRSRLDGTPPISLLTRVSTLEYAGDKSEPLEDIDIEEVDESEVSAYWDQYRTEERLAVVSKSMVTLVRDFPTYSLEQFRRKMRTLKNREASRAVLLFRSLILADLPSTATTALPQLTCMKGGTRWEDCMRTFTRHGHFENLMRMGTEEDLADFKDGRKVEAKGWRYTPFVEAGYGRTGPRDRMLLPKKANETAEKKPDEEPDFSFNWHISLASATPLTLAVSAEVLNDDRINYNGGWDVQSDDWTDSTRQDKSDLLNAALGHHIDPNSRPVLRFLLRQLSNVLFCVSILLTGHYWWSRTSSIGISIAAYALDTLVRVVLFFVSAFIRIRGAPHWEEFAITPFVLVAAALVWNLAAKLEWSWKGWIHVGVTRRRETPAERASARLDAKFSWSQRVLAITLAYLLFLYLPLLPSLVHASPPTHPQLSLGSLSYPHEPTSTSLTRFIKPTYHTSRFVVFLAQALLNHRRQTFGGAYRAVAFLDLGAEVLGALPVVLSSRWGRWEMMDPWKATNVLEVGVRGVLAWQAWRLGRVRGVEEEGEGQDE